MAPRPIIGSAGSRIRLIFGDTGNSWLLLLDNDNGDIKWQSTAWNGIPIFVANQLKNCERKGHEIKGVDFGPDGAWFINGEKPDGSGNNSWWGNTSESDKIKEWASFPLQVSFGTDLSGGESCVIVQGDNGYHFSSVSEDLRKRLKRMNEKEKKINFVHLFDKGQFFISDEEGSRWSLSNSHCRKELLNKKVEEVAVAGDGSWVVIHEDSFESSVSVDPNLDEKLSEFFSDQLRWINERRQEILYAHAAEERERLAREQAAADEAREAAERAAREEEEAAERAERERVQREGMEAAERAEQEAATRISSLEAILVERLVEEAKDIRELEAHLARRKQSFRDAMQSMPTQVQSRISLGGDPQGEADSSSTNNTCVVCRDESAVMAIVPCGHVCLCSACSDTCMVGQNDSRVCPLCRGNMQSVLRIYMGTGRASSL